MKKKKIYIASFLLLVNLILYYFDIQKKSSYLIKTERVLRNEKNEQEIINETNTTAIVQTQNIINTILSSSDKINEQKIKNRANEISNVEKNEVMNNSQNVNIISTIIDIHKKENNINMTNITNIKIEKNNNLTKIINQNKDSIIDIKINKTTKIKKIGVISADHNQNIGNNLLKYTMFIKLKEFGFEPEIIGYLRPRNNISFLNKTINIRCIKKSFREIKRDDYDILMVNSDQVWRKTNLNYLDVGFLRFASNWNIRKFIYGASFGVDNWIYYRYEETIIKRLLRNFTGISVREEGLKEMVEDYLNISPTLVVDPTILIDKKYYLDLIKNYKNEYTSRDNYIFVYSIDKIPLMESFIKKSVKALKCIVYNCTMNDNDYVQRFIYGIYNSKAVITNSFHGVIFSIIFKKPFVAFNPKEKGNERFNTLKYVYGLKKRIVSENNPPKISLLTGPFNVDMKIFDDLRSKSIDYLKKNLEIN